ncbi:DUF6020 family protein, partial [Desemzia incerta]|uniref:DUF6020 family protein n=1 Tax=Desemzia incerta TaxID=82801 RepID=UPI003D04E591
MKNPILAVILLVCNFSLFLLDHYSVFVFMTLCLLIAITVSVRLLASKKIIISLGFFILFYTLLNVFSFWLNPPQWFGYYLIISFTKMFLYVGLLWAYLSVNRHYFDTKIKNYINQSSKIKTNSRQFSCIHIGIIALVLCIIYGIYFVAFSPGNMYIDSYSQWGQAMGGIPLDDWHPVFSTLLLRVSYKLIGTPAIFTLFQVVASIAVFTYLSYILLKRNVRPLLVYFFVFFLMFATVTIPSMVTIYKDNIYNIAILFLVLFLYESVDSKGKWLREKWFHSIALAVAFIFVMLSRHNGIYVVIASLLLIILFSKNLRLYFLGMLSFLMVVNWLYTGPLFSYYEVESGSPSEKYSILLQQIGSVIAYDGEITSEEEEFLNQILPLDT